MSLTVSALCQYTLVHTSGDPEQNLVHTWGFLLDDADFIGAAGTVQTSLLTLYNTIDQYLSADFNTAAEVTKWYNLAAPKPRTPFRSDNLASVTAGSGRLPGQVALCVSYHGTFVSGSNPARRKGRMFFGPLYNAACDSTTGRPAGAMITAVAGAFDAFLTASDAASTWRWCVYSRADDDMHAITAGWVDNSFDVQRRRQATPTSRTTFG